jgi:ubiquinone/menaquinone biosynthesis C-methylase UbiE
MSKQLVTETKSDRSAAGEGWRAIYEAGEISWFRPEYASCAYLRRMGQSEWLQRLVRHTRLDAQRGARILDAGCGIGLYSLSLAVMGHRVSAFDYNAQAVERAQALQTIVGQECSFEPVRFYQDNLLEAQQPTGEFDVVFNQGVLDYFPLSERAQALKEMVRMTKPGGYVAVIVQHTAHKLRPWWEKLGWEGYTRQPPVMPFTPQILGTALRDIGLKNVTVDGIEPWRVLFFYPRWHQRWRVTNELVYLTGRGLRFVPLPRALRAQMAIQILAVGRKV